MKESIKNKTLIIHDFFATNGGAEKVTIYLSKIIKNSRIYTSYVNQKMGIFNDKEIISFLKPTGINIFDFLLIFLGFLNFKTKMQPNSIIFSGIFAPLAQNKFSCKKIYYCHTPPKFLFLRDHWLRKYNWIFWPILEFYKRRYIFSLKKMDIIYANSKYTQDNLKKYFSIDSRLLYPPVGVQHCYNKIEENFYLSTGRLEKPKNVEIVINSFIKLPSKKLIVSSGGTLYKKLYKKYKEHKNISFTNWLKKEDQLEYLSKCIATIYVPSNEDFGISAVESLASGKPVIGLDAGGQREILEHKKNAYICSESSLKEDIIKAVHFLDPSQANNMKNYCIYSSQKFKDSVFDNEIKNRLKNE